MANKTAGTAMIHQSGPKISSTRARARPSSLRRAHASSGDPSSSSGSSGFGTSFSGTSGRVARGAYWACTGSRSDSGVSGASSETSRLGRF